MGETIKNNVVKITVGSIIGVLIFCISMTWYVAAERGKMWDKLQTCEIGMEHITTELNKMQVQIDENETTGTEVKVKLASIEAQLAGITITLQEIKQAVK
jgi:copper chaperone CopZ